MTTEKRAALGIPIKVTCEGRVVAEGVVPYIIDREKRSAEDLIAGVLFQLTNAGNSDWTPEAKALTDALALIRKDRERVERAIAYLRSKQRYDTQRHDTNRAIAILEGKGDA